MNRSEYACFVTLILYLLALALFLGGFSVDYWLENDSGHSGLWRTCVDTGSDVTCSYIDIKEQEGWMKSVIALMVLSLVFCLVAGLSMIVWPVSATLQCFTGVSTLAGVIIFGMEVTDDLDLSWGFGMTAAGGTLFLLNGVLLAALTFRNGCSVRPAVRIRMYRRRRPRHATETKYSSMINFIYDPYSTPYRLRPPGESKKTPEVHDAHAPKRTLDRPGWRWTAGLEPQPGYRYGKY